VTRLVEKYHDFSYGHTVYRHESKCAWLHGHNGRVHFILEADELDSVGRVIDFGMISKLLCDWVERNWDHRFLVWEEDPRADTLKAIDDKVIKLNFNPTAENLAEFLVKEVGPAQLIGTNVKLVSCRFEETRKCAATFSLGKEV
jgi:6-pyruvoyltetrahydropterin/6-carboxytetrahydropterin synthase